MMVAKLRRPSRACPSPRQKRSPNSSTLSMRIWGAGERALISASSDAGGMSGKSSLGRVTPWSISSSDSADVWARNGA